MTKYKTPKPFQSVKAQFLLFLISLFVVLIIFCGVLIYSASNAIAEESIQYAQEDLETFQSKMADMMRQIDSAFIQLQYERDCQRLLAATSWDQVSPEIVRNVNTAVTSIKMSNSAISEISFVSGLIQWSNLYLPKQIDKMLEAMPASRNAAPLGIFYPSLPKSSPCLVFGYPYYTGRMRLGTLLISVELSGTSGQFPAPQIPGFYLVLTDAKGDSFSFGLEDSPSSSELKALLSQAPSGSAMRHSGTYLLQSAPLPQIDGTILCAVNQLQIQPSLDSFYITTVVFLIIFIALLLYGNGVFYRSVISPLNELTNTIAFIRENKLRKLDRPLVLNGCSELRTVGRDFSELLVSINTLTSEILTKSNALYEAEVLRQNAELNGLRSQINPHFLYNTLELIRAMALKGDNDHVSLVTSAMGKIYRYTAKGDALVPLAHEIDIVKSYVSIQQARFEGRITTLYNVSPQAASVPVLKMLLQPLVENAFIHGLEAREEGGALYIGAQTTDRLLLISIRDNGIGMNPEQLAEVEHRLATNHYDTSQHLGLANVNARLRLQYGDAYGLQLSSSPGDGTCVVIRIPLSAK